LEVTQELVDRLKEYQVITNNTPKASHVVFNENCFFFADNDLLEKYIQAFFPEIRDAVEKLSEGHFFATSDDRMACEHVMKVIELPKTSCDFVKLYRYADPVFFTYNEYSNVEYWFQVSIEYLEKVLKDQAGKDH
jgi:hypothetical protein